MDKHVHDVLNLLAPVSNREFPFFKFLGHFLLLVRILMGDILDVFHQSLDVSETEKLGNKRLWRKLFEIMQVLADAEEDNRRLGRSNTDHGTCVSSQWAAVTSVTTYAEIAPPPLA